MPELMVTEYGQEEPEKGQPEPDEQQQKAVRKCYDWFVKDKDAKIDYVREMDENDLLYEGKHWDLPGPDGTPLRTREEQQNHPNSVENVTFSLTAGLVAEFAQDVDLTDFPVDENDAEVATMMTDLKEFIAQKNGISTERLKWLWNFFGHGTGIWKHAWDPTWQGGRGPNKWLGDVRWQSRHPRYVFPDARCGENIHDGRRIHDARYVTLEYVKERYPKFGHLAREGVMDSTIIAADEDAAPETREGQTLLVETWYIGKPLVDDPDNDEGRTGTGLHVIWWCGEDQPVFLTAANYVYFGANEQPKFPFTFRQRYPRKVGGSETCWGHGEGWFIKHPQIMLNKNAELVIEGHAHQTFGQTFYRKGVFGDEKQKRKVERDGNLAGGWFEVDDPKGILRLYGNGVPASVLSELNRLPRVMEMITGRFDVSQGKAPGSVTAFRALDLLAQRAQVRLRAADVAITTGYEEVGWYINQLIPGHYTESRAVRIIGKDEFGKMTVRKRSVFKAESILRVYDLRTGKVVPKAQFVPPPGYVEGEDYEVYAPELDVVCRTTTQMPSDRVFYLEVAKELYGAKLIDLEVFYYVLENGKFPPFSEVKQKMMSLQQQEPAMPLPTGQMDAAPTEEPDISPNIVALMQQLPKDKLTLFEDPDALNQFVTLPEPEQEALLLTLMEEGKERRPNQQPAPQPTAPAV